MKLKTNSLCLAVLVGMLLGLSLPGEAQEENRYDGSWESLQQMPVPAWFDDGKIGIFIHWGPYSVIGYKKGGRGYAEHVPKGLYRDPDHYYPYMKKRWGAHPPEFGYKDILPEFKAENWDPDAWASLFKEVGAHYVVLTAEHHDGWANWDSDLTPWNAVEMGPKRDLVGDLAKAVRKQGLKFAPSYHRERHSSFFAEKLYVVHATPLPDIVEEIKRRPEAASLYGPFGFSKDFVDDYVARWKEIQAKYHPDMLWLDDFPIYTRDGNQVRSGVAKPEIQYLDDQVRGMITDFMNEGAAQGQAVYCNNKGANRNWPDGVGCLEKDNLKLEVIGPKWQSCTTFGTSFGYLENDKYKSVEGVIHEMIEVISRNGNFLINIGPKSDGTIAAPQLKRLRAMGDWLKINGEAIYGSRYWKVNQQEKGHLAFTTNGKTLYAIAMKKPRRSLTIEATAGWSADQITSVKLLGAKAGVRWRMTPAGLQITPPANLGRSKYAWAFAIETSEEQHHPNAIQTDASAALKGTKAVDLEGNAGKDGVTAKSTDLAVQPTKELPHESELYEGAEFKEAFSNPQDDPTRPNVLLIGDSISIGYTVEVRKLLKGKADVFRIKGNGRNAAFGQEHIDNWLEGRKWDVIHFNWGLWDLCYRHSESKEQGHRDKIRGSLTATPEEYKAALEKILPSLKATGATLIWCATTPVPDHEAGRKKGDAIRYNAIAAELMKENGIVINDLHSYALLKLPGIMKKKGDVHFSTEGYAYLAQKVAAEIEKQLGLSN